jgi:hypothetical protein
MDKENTPAAETTPLVVKAVDAVTGGDFACSYYKLADGSLMLYIDCNDANAVSSSNCVNTVRTLANRISSQEGLGRIGIDPYGGMVPCFEKTQPTPLLAPTQEKPVWRRNFRLNVLEA